MEYKPVYYSLHCPLVTARGAIRAWVDGKSRETASIHYHAYYPNLDLVNMKSCQNVADLLELTQSLFTFTANRFTTSSFSSKAGID